MKILGIVHVILLCQLFPTEVLSQGSQRVNMQCEIENADGNLPHVQGVQVKIGPKGEVGPQGLPGRVDYERINSATDEKIESGLTSLRSDIVKKLDENEDKMQALQKQFSLLPSREVLENLFSQITDQLNENAEKIQSLQKQLSSLPSHQDVHNLQVNKTDEKIKTAQKEGRCDFVHKRTCYWIEVHDTNDVDTEEAKSICKKRQSVLSYPVDEVHYGLIIKEMRLKMPSGRNRAHVWTGLRINPSTGDVTVATGGTAPYVKWYYNYPTRRSTSTGVLMQMTSDPAASLQGLYNYTPSSNTFGAICQYELFDGN